MSSFNIKKGDTKPSISATLTINAVPIGNLTGATVRFLMRSLDGSVLKVNAVAVVVSPTACTVRYDWVAGDTDTVGIYLVEWRVTYGDLTEQTVPNTGFDQVLIGNRLP